MGACTVPTAGKSQTHGLSFEVGSAPEVTLVLVIGAVDGGECGEATV